MTFEPNWNIVPHSKINPNILFVISDDCGGLMEEESGSIQTPNCPLNYPVDKVCAWIIKTQPGDKVVLSFEAFALESNAVCQYDYVLVRDGSSSKSPMVGKFCGTSRPATITSTGNYLWIGFRSDSSSTEQGFKAVWTTEKSSTPTISTTPAPTPTPTPTPTEGLLFFRKHLFCTTLNGVFK